MTNKEPTPDPLQRVKDVYKAPFRYEDGIIWDANNFAIITTSESFALWLVDKLNEEWGKEA